MDPVIVLEKFKVRSFTRSGIIAIGVLGGGCEPPILGKRRIKWWVGNGTVLKSVGVIGDFL